MRQTLEDRAYEIYKLDWLRERNYNPYNMVRYASQQLALMRENGVDAPELSPKMALAEWKNAAISGETEYPALAKKSADRWSWMIEREYGLEDLWHDVAKNYLKAAYDYDILQRAFELWEKNDGFDGDIYPTEEDFLINTFPDEAEMDRLLAHHEQLHAWYNGENI